MPTKTDLVRKQALGHLKAIELQPAGTDRTLAVCEALIDTLYNLGMRDVAMAANALVRH